MMKVMKMTGLRNLHHGSPRTTGPSGGDDSHDSLALENLGVGIRIAD